jgi:hypothetical protein
LPIQARGSEEGIHVYMGRIKIDVRMRRAINIHLLRLALVDGRAGRLLVE